MNSTRALLVLTTMVLVFFVPAVVINVSGMGHTFSAGSDLGSLLFAGAAILVWFASYMLHWKKCQR